MHQKNGNQTICHDQKVLMKAFTLLISFYSDLLAVDSFNRDISLPINKMQGLIEYTGDY